VRTEVLADFGAPAAPTQAIEIDGLRLEMRGPMAQVGLTSSEFKLLKAFARSPGQALRTEEIRHVIEPGAASQASQARQGRLTVLIHRLRRKLMQAGADARAIRAQRKQGYELVCRIRLHDPLQPQAGRPRA
jgi:DNA-binding response OmpR family regulator